MSEEKELKKGDEEVSEVEENAEDIEGYAFCSSVKQKCMNDCLGGGPFVYTIH